MLHCVDLIDLFAHNYQQRVWLASQTHIIRILFPLNLVWFAELTWHCDLNWRGSSTGWHLSKVHHQIRDSSNAKSKIASPFRKSCILQPSLHFSHYTQWRSDNWNSTGFQNIWLPFEAHLATWRRLLSASTSHAMDPHLAFPPLRWQIPTKSLPASASSPHVRV